jgi:dihydropteroate synthase
MHSRGNPQTMQQLTNYHDVVKEVTAYFHKKTEECHKAGIKQLILAPGFGFAKTVAQNYRLFNHIKTLTELNMPLLIGISRKTMIWRPLEITPEQALSATAALHLQALLQGASILRVHDVKETKQIIKLWELIKTC